MASPRTTCIRSAEIVGSGDLRENRRPAISGSGWLSLRWSGSTRTKTRQARTRFEAGVDRPRRGGRGAPVRAGQAGAVRHQGRVEARVGRATPQAQPHCEGCLTVSCHRPALFGGRAWCGGRDSSGRTPGSNQQCRLSNGREHSGTGEVMANVQQFLETDRIVGGRRSLPARYPAGTVWPTEMRADMASAFFDMPSTFVLAAAIQRNEAPAASAWRIHNGRRVPVWCREVCERFVEHRHGLSATPPANDNRRPQNPVELA